MKSGEINFPPIALVLGSQLNLVLWFLIVKFYQSFGSPLPVKILPAFMGGGHGVEVITWETRGWCLFTVGLPMIPYTYLGSLRYLWRCWGVQWRQMDLTDLSQQLGFENLQVWECNMFSLHNPFTVIHMQTFVSVCAINFSYQVCRWIQFWWLWEFVYIIIYVYVCWLWHSLQYVVIQTQL